MTPTSHVFVLVEEPLLRITLRLLLATTDNLILAGEAAFIYDLPSFTIDNCPQVLLCEIGGVK